MGLEQLKRSLDEKMNPNYFRDVDILKKNKKPLMERCRRRKINNYLEELKYLVLSALNKEIALYNKMEKADILDMAVKYIKAIRTHPDVSTTNYRQAQMSSQENSTSLGRNYEIPSPTPLQPRIENVIYKDNTYPPPKEIVKDTANVSKDEQDDKICVQMSCKDGKIKTNEQFDNSRNENTITISNEQIIPKSEIPSIQTTAIWRPW